MLANAVVLALRTMRRNPLRSFLTTLGIVIGVAAVITMVTLGNGATRAVTDQISAMGSNLLTVLPGQRFGAAAEPAPAFKAADAEAVRQQLAAVQAVAPLSNKAVTAVVQARNWTTIVAGSSNDYFSAGNWRLAAGRTFNETEERSGKAVCVIGDTVRRNLFGAQEALGSDLRLKRFSCEVIGLLAPKGQAAMGQDQDDVIVMPLKTVQRRLTGSTDIGRLMVAVREGADNAAVTRQLAETLTGTTRILTWLLGAVAAVSLLVGGIGIMNIMLVSVTERTREIGIRLAVGALEEEVLLQFLVEAVVLACVGGAVGLLLAAAASVGLAGAMGVPWAFDAGINALAFGFAAVIGVVFGYFPARRAARLDPIEALRHE